MAPKERAVKREGGGGYHKLHVSEGPVLNGKVGGEVIRQVIGVAAGVGRTHGTDHLLREGGRGEKHSHIHVSI